MNGLTKKIVTVIAAAFVLIMGIFISPFSTGAVASAAMISASTYSNVINDLLKDNEFNLNDYPDIADDYSIKVIQIAESTDGELFIYTYQPCQKTKYLTATKINMSLTERMGGQIDNFDDLADIDKPKLYDLILLSCEGVFCKYVVLDFTVSASIARYYNISSIYRNYIDEDGDTTGSSNLLGSKAFAVSQLWTAVTYNGNVGYSRTDTMVVEIRPDQKYVGYVRYLDGYHFGFYWSSDDMCDSWYVAFDCNYKIDDLYEADVVYDKRTYDVRYNSLGRVTSEKYSEWQCNIPVTLKQDRIIGNELSGLWGRKHEWAEIQSVADFIETEDLKTEAQELLQDKQWVIRFALTDYYVDGTPGLSAYTTSGSEIANVGIIRLSFEMDGKKYNLGVVDSLQTPDPDAPPDNNPDTPDYNNGIFAWLSRKLGIPETILKLIAAVLALVILLPILSAIFPVFGQFLVWAMKGIVWLICLPFKAISSAVKANKKRK